MYYLYIDQTFILNELRRTMYTDEVIGGVIRLMNHLGEPPAIFLYNLLFSACAWDFVPIVTVDEMYQDNVSELEQLVSLFHSYPQTAMVRPEEVYILDNPSPNDDEMYCMLVERASNFELTDDIVNCLKLALRNIAVNIKYISQSNADTDRVTLVYPETFSREVLVLYFI